MKVCTYCGNTVEDSLPACPYCNSTSFKYKCPRCGTVSDGSDCPVCIAKDEQKRERERVAREQAVANAEARARANSGLVWKTVLTVLLPFVGGYFLINDNVRKGFKSFGIAWCALFAVAAGTASGDSSTSTRIFTSLLCLGPIGVYLFRFMRGSAAEGVPRSKVPLIAFAVLVVVSLVCDIAGGARAVSSDEQLSGAGAKATSAELSSASSASSVPGESRDGAQVGAAAEAAAAATASASAGRINLDDVELASSAKYLEYSNKKLDPLTLVACDEPSVDVRADGELDLSAVGVQKVPYTLSLDGDTATRKVKFVVRDTKAPKISLSKKKAKIDAGDSFDPRSCIGFVTDKVDGNLAFVSSPPAAQGSKPGLERFYDQGWYTVEGGYDATVPGTYDLTVRASDVHGNEATKSLFVTVSEPESAEGAAPAANQHTYIVNTNTGKFHIPGCRDIAKMSDSNKLEKTSTRDEMIAQGYSPCGHCLP